MCSEQHPGFSSGIVQFIEKQRIPFKHLYAVPGVNAQRVTCRHCALILQALPVHHDIMTLPYPALAYLCQDNIPTRRYTTHASCLITIPVMFSPVQSLHWFQRLFCSLVQQAVAGYAEVWLN